MSFISVFDVLGPNMLGPSSSHTAGAAAIALLARKMFHYELKTVRFTLYGSFAQTYKGHGTDRALLGGIMGFSTDDRRIPDSFTMQAKPGFLTAFLQTLRTQKFTPTQWTFSCPTIKGTRS